MSRSDASDSHSAVSALSRRRSERSNRANGLHEQCMNHHSPGTTIHRSRRRRITGALPGHTGDTGTAAIRR
ncbi:hypothetical protein [Streptomyces sp. NBC_01233]|uniref:hypothetical protein n=1 Tax=Streptomyces sp. NBC_01233 TaxID=2903787 RepID=UPI002E12A065|nr:hypothetical protein OG332_28495 [Streptomyces sp. NBC_01233]